MAIYYNPNTYDIGANQPIDSRFIKGTNALRDAIPEAVRYEGLTVYVSDPAGDSSLPGASYVLQGGITNSDWVSSISLGALWETVTGVTTNIGTDPVSVTSHLKVPEIRPIVDGVATLKFTKADGTGNLLVVDSSNSRIGIGTATPSQALHVVGTTYSTVSLIAPTIQGNAIYPLSSADLVVETRPSTSGNNIIFRSTGTTPTETARMTTAGKVGIGETNPTAWLHIKAGTVAAGTSPLKFTSGALLTAPEAGSIEFLTDAYYATITTGTERKQFAFRETTLDGYGITDAVRIDANGTITGTLTLVSNAASVLNVKHDYTAVPDGASLIDFIDESDVSVGYVGIAATTQALTLSSSASTPLISLASPTRADSGIQFIDATTYITRDGSNNLSFTDAVSGTRTLAQLLAGHVWTVDGNDIYSNNTGNVGIGATPTAGYKLDVSGDIRYTGKLVSAVLGSDSIELDAQSASGYKFRIYDATNTTNLLHINASGQVGINTNTQTDQFAVVANTDAIYAGNFTNVHATGQGVYIAGGATTESSLYVGDRLGTKIFNITPTYIESVAPLRIDQINEYTASNGTSFPDSVGIGHTSTPSATLDVRGSSQTAIYSSTNSANQGLYMYNAGRGSAARFLKYTADGSHYEAILELWQASLTGVAAVGMGVYADFRLDNVAGAYEQAGQIGVKWTDVTLTAEDSKMVFGVMKAGVYTDVLELYSTYSEFTGDQIINGKLTVKDTATQLAIQDTDDNEIWYLNANAGIFNIVNNSNSSIQISNNITSGPLLAISDASVQVRTNFYVDTIDEYASNAGVTVEGVLLKDEGISLLNTGGTNPSLIYASAGDTMLIKPGGNGLYIDKDSSDNLLRVYDNSQGSNYYTSITGGSVSQLDNSIVMWTLNKDGLALQTGATVNEIETVLTNDDTHLPTSGAVYDAIAQTAQGWVNTTGTPVDNQIAIFTDANTVEGDANLTWDGGVLDIIGGALPLELSRAQNTNDWGVGQSYRMQNSISAWNNYASIYGMISDNTAGAEYGKLGFYIDINSTLTKHMGLTSTGLMIGSSSDASARLHVVGGDFYLINSTADPRIVIGESTSGGEYAFLDWNRASDYLAIGTSTGGDAIRIQEDDSVELLGESKVDTINEYTSGAGVTIEGVVIKDDGATAGTGWAPTVDQDFATKVYIDDLITPITFPANSITTNTGTDVSGDIDSIASIDDADEYIVDEATGTPGFDIEVAFIDVDHTVNNITVNAYYDGTSAHVINVEMYNYTDIQWDKMGELIETADFGFQTFDITGTLTDYIDGSDNAKIRFYHSSAGNITHTINLDYVVLKYIPIAGGGGGGVTDHGALGGLSDNDHPQYALTASMPDPVLPIGSKSSATDAGTQGDMSLNDDFLYVCTTTGTAGNAIWKRTILSVSP